MQAPQAVALLVWSLFLANASLCELNATAGDGSTRLFECKFASFANAGSWRSVTLPLAIGLGKLGCSDDESTAGWKDSFVLLERGTCEFGRKVLTVAAAGGHGVIIGNNADDQLGRVKMQTALSSARNLTLPVLMISRTDLEQLKAMSLVGVQFQPATITRRGMYEVATSGVAIEPENLSGGAKLPVHLWRRQSKLGKRSYLILKDSLSLHPAVRLVAKPEQAQIVLWHTVGEDIKSPAASGLSANITSMSSQLVVVDYADLQQLHQDGESVSVGSSGEQLEEARDMSRAPECLTYFKRSWVLRHRGVSMTPFKHPRSAPNVLPTSYCIAHQFLSQAASATAACKQLEATSLEATSLEATSGDQGGGEGGEGGEGGGGGKGGGEKGGAAAKAEAVKEWLQGRDLLLSCTLRADGAPPSATDGALSSGAANDTSSARSRVIEWAEEASRSLGLSVVHTLDSMGSVGSMDSIDSMGAAKGSSAGSDGSGSRIGGTVLVGQASHSSRGSIDADYFAALRRSRVVLTANPSEWEGDWRLWEALASGALVLVDRMITVTRMGTAPQWAQLRQSVLQQRWEEQAPPMSHPLVHGTHVLVYDSTDREGFIRLLKQVLTAVADKEATDLVTGATTGATMEAMEAMAGMACAGHLHALRHHTCVHRVDGMLRMAIKRQQQQQQQQQEEEGGGKKGE
jgi:hypothetical protein